MLCRKRKFENFREETGDGNFNVVGSEIRVRVRDSFYEYGYGSRNWYSSTGPKSEIVMSTGTGPKSRVQVRVRVQELVLEYGYVSQKVDGYGYGYGYWYGY